MAVVVNYWANFKSSAERDEAKQEGPFVAVNVCGWRVEEVQDKGRCPVLPHYSIWYLAEASGFGAGKTVDFAKVAQHVRFLNNAVVTGVIEKHPSGYHYCPAHCRHGEMESQAS